MLAGLKIYESTYISLYLISVGFIKFILNNHKNNKSAKTVYLNLDSCDSRSRAMKHTCVQPSFDWSTVTNGSVQFVSRRFIYLIHSKNYCFVLPD